MSPGRILVASRAGPSSPTVVRTLVNFNSAGGWAGAPPSAAAIVRAVNMENPLSSTGPVRQFQHRIVSRVDARDQPESKCAPVERAGRAVRGECTAGRTAEICRNDFRRTGEGYMIPMA